MQYTAIYWGAYWKWRFQGFSPETSNRLALVADNKTKEKPIPVIADGQVCNGDCVKCASAC
jgi:hypothetical protein